MLLVFPRCILQSIGFCGCDGLVDLAMKRYGNSAVCGKNTCQKKSIRNVLNAEEYVWVYFSHESGSTPDWFPKGAGEHVKPRPTDTVDDCEVFL